MKRCLECGALHVPDTLKCARCGKAPPSIDGFVAYAPDLARQSAGFRPEQFAELARHEAGNFWFRARNEMILDALSSQFPEMSSMLEIGCGTGYVLEGVRRAYPHLALTGSEIYTDGLRFAQERVPDLQLLQMDARSIPYEDEFDVVGAFDVIEHIDDDRAVLAQMYRALRPGGGVLLTVPQHPSLWSAQDEVACHVRRYRRGELEAKLADAGLSVTMSTSFVTLLLPAMALSRLGKKKEGDFDAASEFNISPALNTLLHWVLRLEAAMIRHGARFPIGGTRLVAARK